jgi:hypothetical protein
MRLATKAMRMRCTTSGPSVILAPVCIALGRSLPNAAAASRARSVTLFLGQTVLQSEVCALDTAFGLGRVRADDINIELIKGAAKTE